MICFRSTFGSIDNFGPRNAEPPLAAKLVLERTAGGQEPMISQRITSIEKRLSKLLQQQRIVGPDFSLFQQMSTFESRLFRAMFNDSDSDDVIAVAVSSATAAAAIAAAAAAAAAATAAAAADDTAASAVLPTASPPATADVAAATVAAADIAAAPSSSAAVASPPRYVAEVVSVESDEEDAPPPPPVPARRQRRRLTLATSSGSGSASSSMHRYADVIDETRDACRSHAIQVCAELMGSSARVCKRLGQLLARESGSHCYVGATVNPVRRWCGDTDTGMIGHEAKYMRMVVFAISKSGARARRLETSLISTARQLAPASCDNVASDGRGQSQRGPNFLYVCFRW